MHACKEIGSSRSVHRALVVWQKYDCTDESSSRDEICIVSSVQSPKLEATRFRFAPTESRTTRVGGQGVGDNVSGHNLIDLPLQELYDGVRALIDL